jgi:hypothetical protein
VETVPSAGPGQTRTEVAEVVRYAWSHPFSVSSNYARAAASWVAIAASEGFLTVRIGPDRYTRSWRITQRGLDYIKVGIE